ncbi:BQ2448_5752 [Microbotryum intermedium]|uniref:BQ2448_5752 protein n=1 Tax=Microbotryum intermedium TaxID=269621 RepID=A0A238F7P2_9BASI|nr:BQ2448_5752 [Microbotryum intermedium]
MTAPPDWATITTLFDTARCDLYPGQMIKANQSSLLDLMGAIEIMDPRTDSYLLHQQSPVSSNLPSFDPTQDIRPRELIWVLDELLGLEALITLQMKFLDGFPLASTVLECQYLRPNALSELASTAAASPSIWPSILLEMLLSVVQCTQMIWQELCKAQVYEHEDVHLGLGGLDFESLSQAGSSSFLARTGDGKTGTTIDDVVHRLDASLAGLQQLDSCDPTLCNAIAARLQLRIHLMCAYATLATPSQVSPHNARRHLECVAHFLPLAQHWDMNSRSISFQPHARLLAIFSSQSAPLPTPHPPHCTAQLGSNEAWGQLRCLITHLLGSVQTWQRFLSEGSWHDLAGWSHLGRGQQVLGQPYARSVQQSILWSDGACMGSLTPLSLASSFLFAMVGLDPPIWQQLLDLRTREESWDGPARRILGWAHQLGLTLIRTLQIAAQNPSRQRRLLIKEFSAWPILIAKALQALLEGQDLALLTSVDCRQTGWVVSGLATLLENQLGGLLQVLQQTSAHMPQENWGLKLLLHAQQAHKLGQDMFLMGKTSGPLHPCGGGLTESDIFGSAFLPRCEVLQTRHKETCLQLRFGQRFGWVQGHLTECDEPLDEFCSYAAYNGDLRISAKQS